MKRFKMRTGLMVALAALFQSYASAGYLWDNFESYLVGTNLSALAARGWGASDTTVVVVTNVYDNTTRLAAMPLNTAATGAVGVAGAGMRIWSDCLLSESQRMDPATLPPSPNAGAMAIAAVTTDGYAVVYNPASNGWDFCTRDALGNVLSSGAASGTWARVSVCMDFGTSNAAVWLDGRLMRAGIPFITNRTAWTGIRFRSGAVATGYVDEVYVSNAVPPALAAMPLSATNDINGDGLSDAQEIMAYGALAVRVRADYPTLAAALAANPVAGRIVVEAGGYAENVVVSNATTFIGSVLTNLTSLTVVTGQVATLSGITNFSCATLTIGTNASLSLVGGTATVSTLTFQVGAAIRVTNGTLVANGMTLSGTFTVDSGLLGVLSAQSVNYANDFESYAEGMPLNRCGGQGWWASDPAAVVQSTVVTQLLRAAMVTGGNILSNAVQGAVEQTGIWTDLYVQDRGIRYSGLAYPSPHAGRAVALFVNTNNRVVVWNTGAWDECARDVCGNAGPLVATGQWVRVTVYEDFTATNAALFVNGQLLRQQVPFVSPVGRYGGFCLSAGNGGAYLDDVRVWTNMPPGLTNGAHCDLDGDGIPDALEIQNFGTVALWPRGSVFRIR